jgi:hypothetical protein
MIFVNYQNVRIPLSFTFYRRVCRDRIWAFIAFVAVVTIVSVGAKGYVYFRLTAANNCERNPNGGAVP